MSSVTLIISVSVIILLIYVVFTLLRQKSYVGSVQKASVATIVNVKPNSSAAAAYSIWIYVSEWNNGSKVIFQRGNTGTGSETSDLILALSNNTNKLELTITGSTANTSFTKYQDYYYLTQSSTYYSASENNCQILCGSSGTCQGYNFYKTAPTTTPVDTYKTSMTTEGCELLYESPTTLKNGLSSNSGVTGLPNIKIKNTPATMAQINTFIPLQEWVFITINMDTNYTEVYINGKMVQTIMNTNKQHTGKIVTISPGGSGFTGYNSKFQNFNKTLTNMEIWNNYKYGFGSHFSLSDYSVKVDFYKD